jgi:hypothetical protein
MNHVEETNFCKEMELNRAGNLLDAARIKADSSGFNGAP